MEADHGLVPYSEGFATIAEDDSAGCFKAPAPPSELEKMSFKRFPPNTVNKIDWAVKLYTDWWFQRIKLPGCDPRIRWMNLQNLKLLNKSNFAISLVHFITEIQHVDGQDYPPQTLRQIALMLQFHLEHNGLDLKLLDNAEFKNFRFTVDNLMKECTAAGLGQKKSSAAISFVDEELLWQKGVLGTDSPDQLRETLLYLLGINFALQGGGGRT